MKRFLLLLIILTGGFCLPFSCDESGTAIGSEIYIESLGIRVGLFDSLNTNPFSAIPEDRLQTDTLDAGNFVIELSIDGFRNATSLHFDEGAFLNSAFAKRIAPGSSSTIDLISIYSELPIYAEGVTYAAVDNLTNLFLARNYYGDLKSVLKFTDSFDRWQLGDMVYLKLNAILDKPIDQTFRVKVTMEDGTVFNLETPKLLIK